MSYVDTATGEIVAPLDRMEAERLTTRIRLRLDIIADNYVGVMPLIREAIDRQAYAALGYSGVSQYVSECFGDALSHLGVEVRREVVRELTDAGMSTRAIAPVVGTSHMSVKRDLDHAGVTTVTPTSQSQQGEAARESAPEVPVQHPHSAPSIGAPRPVVTGLDGKTYSPRTATTERRTDVVATINRALLKAREAAAAASQINPSHMAGRKEEAAVWSRDLEESIRSLNDLLKTLEGTQS